MALNVVNGIRTLLGISPATGSIQAIAGAEGDQIVSELHGKWYYRAKSLQSFIGSTAIAGTIIPVNAASLVSTFSLYNPIGSGVNLELIRYRLGLAGTTTAVIGNVGLAFQTTYALVTQNLGGITSTLLGGSTSQKGIIHVKNKCTGTPSFLETLGLSFGTTGANPGPVAASVEFDGSILVPPGAAVMTVANAAQTQAMAQSITWAEIPTTV